MFWECYPKKSVAEYLTRALLFRQSSSREAVNIFWINASLDVTRILALTESTYFYSGNNLLVFINYQCNFSIHSIRFLEHNFLHLHIYFPFVTIRKRSNPIKMYYQSYLQGNSTKCIAKQNWPQNKEDSITKSIRSLSFPWGTRPEHDSLMKFQVNTN